MRAIVLASTALVFLSLPLASCDKIPQGESVYSLLTTGKTCRDPRGRFAKCQTCPDGSRIWTGATCPVPPPHEHPPAGDIPAPSLEGLEPIKSEFDWTLGTVPMSATAMPGTAAPDILGAFRFGCGFAGVGRFDPKVHPGDTTGKSHGHQFYGNTGINPASTYASLRTSGKSTCGYGDYPLNRSGYWEPWMEDGNGNIIQPDHVTIYYKQPPFNSPACTDPTNIHYQGKCVGLPNGLFFIFGYDFITQKPATGKMEWGCIDGAGKAFYAASIPEAIKSGLCIPGGRLVSRGKAPSCWDGKRVDSANHRDHVGYATKINPATGRLICDDAHPYAFPGYTLLVSRQIKESDDLSKWKLSSDALRPDLPYGSTYHVDFFMAHDPSFKNEWNLSPDSCIQALLSCSGWGLSKARAWPKASQPYYPDAAGVLRPNWNNPKRVIPIPGAEANTKLVGF